MAWTLDKATIGNQWVTTGNNVLTTTAAVSSGALVVASLFISSNTATGSVAGGGLTWVSVIGPIRNGTSTVYVIVALAPSGLASSSSLTATVSGSDSIFGAASFLGGRTTTADTTGSSTTATGTAWSGGAMTNVSGGDLVVSTFATDAGALTLSSPSGTIAWQNANATGLDACGLMYVLSSGGSVTQTGTWSATSASSVGASAAFSIPMLVFRPGRMPLGA